MAKKKTTEAPENVASEIQSTEAPAVEAPEEAVAEAETEEVPALVVDAPKVAAADFSALPAQALDYLKRHTEVDAIYIDKFGGMFPKDTPQVFAKNAMLYHNPYFKP